MIFLQLYLSFFKIGLLGFGGGLAIIQLIYDSVRVFIDMDPQQFANIVAIAQVTPGPVAVNMATYVGYEAAGYFGSFVATIGVATPAFILITIAARMVERYKKSSLVKGALQGIRPATVGMIAMAVITLGEPTVITQEPLGAKWLAAADLASESGHLALLSETPLANLDLFAVLIALATVWLIGKKDKSPFPVLIAMGCIGAVLGV